MLKMIEDELNAHKTTLEKTIEVMMPQIEEASKLVIETLKNKNKVLFCGNGGSAADAQHIAAELTGRYKTDRRGLAGIALTTDTSALTAIANDYGFDRVFDRQVEAIAREGDLLIAISTSGNSMNVMSALAVAKLLGCKTIGLSGNDGGEMNRLCHVNLIVPSDDTPRIQEMHILIGHIFCQAVDNAFSK